MGSFSGSFPEGSLFSGKKGGDKMILLTGFAPFDGDKLNPSWEAVKGVRALPGFEKKVDILELPVVFGQAAEKALAQIRLLRPSAVVCVGLAGGRKAVTPEVIAVNLKHARIPDNGGNQPQWEKILPEGPDGIFSRLPVREMADALNAAGIPGALSFSAGTYVCNEVMYRVLHDYQGPAGFIHVPKCLEQGGEMPLREMTDALAKCVSLLFTP